MSRAKLLKLQTVFESKFVADAAHFRRHSQRVDKQRKDIEMLQGNLPMVDADMGFSRFMQSHDEWVELMRRAKNVELAQMLAEHERLELKLRRSFGKSAAVAELLRLQDKPK